MFNRLPLYNKLAHTIEGASPTTLRCMGVLVAGTVLLAGAESTSWQGEGGPGAHANPGDGVVECGNDDPETITVLRKDGSYNAITLQTSGKRPIGTLTAQYIKLQPLEGATPTPQEEGAILPKWDSSLFKQHYDLPTLPTDGGNGPAVLGSNQEDSVSVTMTTSDAPGGGVNFKVQCAE